MCGLEDVLHCSQPNSNLSKRSPLRECLNAYSHASIIRIKPLESRLRALLGEMESVRSTSWRNRLPLIGAACYQK